MRGNMTRINLVLPSELCDQHLLAEFRELTRIPNGILSGKLKSFYPDAPKQYTLGAGHVKFFVDKWDWLLFRYSSLFNECQFRKFNVQYIWPSHFRVPIASFLYRPTPTEVFENKRRVCERMPKYARWTNRVRPFWAK